MKNNLIEFFGKLQNAGNDEEVKGVIDEAIHHLKEYVHYGQRPGTAAGLKAHCELRYVRLRLCWTLLHICKDKDQKTKLTGYRNKAADSYMDERWRLQEVQESEGTKVNLNLPADLHDETQNDFVVYLTKQWETYRQKKQNE